MKSNSAWKYIIIFVIFSTLVLSLLHQPQKNHYSNYDLQKEGWTYSTNQSGHKKEINTPVKINEIKADETVILTNEISGFNGQFDCPSILLQTDHQYIDLFYDHNKIYSNYDPKFYHLDFPGSGYHLLRLPDKVESTMVEIRLSSPYESYSGVIHPIVIGGKSDLIYYTIKNSLAPAMLGMILSFFGAILAISFVIMRYYRHNYTSFCYFGLYVLSLGIETLCSTNLIQFFYNNPIFVDTLQHLASFSSFIFLSAFIYKSVEPNAAKMLKRFNRLLTGCFMLSIAIYYLYDITLHQLYSLYLFPFGIYLCYLIYYRFNSTSKQDSKSIIFNNANVFIASFTLFDTIVSLIDKTNYSFFSYGLGVCIYIFLIMVYIWMSLVENNNNKIRIEMLTQMAYIDYLTKAKNRAAFAEDLDKLNQSLAEQPKICIAIFDLDGLKMANDTYGHHYGDQLLKNYAQLLNATYAELGNIYRIGGDEMTLVAVDQDCAQLEFLASQINSITIPVDDQSTIHCTISYGFTHYNPEIDTCLQDTYKRADKKMYQCKHNQK